MPNGSSKNRKAWKPSRLLTTGGRHPVFVTTVSSNTPKLSSMRCLKLRSEPTLLPAISQTCIHGSRTAYKKSAAKCIPISHSLVRRTTSLPRRHIWLQLCMRGLSLRTHWRHEDASWRNASSLAASSAAEILQTAVPQAWILCRSSRAAAIPGEQH